MTTAPPEDQTDVAAMRDQLLRAGVRPGQLWVMIAPDSPSTGVAFFIGALTTTRGDDTILIQLQSPHNTIRNEQGPGGVLPEWFQPRPGCSTELISVTDFLEYKEARRIVPISDWHC